MAEMDLLERDQLLAKLDNMVEDAREGRGSLVLVAGEAGSGKTSLARALADLVEASTLVLQGACDPLSTPRPLSPLLDFAADPDSGLDKILQESVETIEVFNDVLERLKESIRPVLMIVEDVHWADEGTLDFLRFVGRRVSDSKAVVLCTYRDDEVGPVHPLRAVIGQLIPLSSTRRLVVPPLSRSAVATLATGRAIDPDELHRLTGGNAFFVTEVIAAGEALPESVQDAVLARVANLDPRARRVVEAVAIAPRSLEIERAASLVGARMQQIDLAVGSGVLLGDGKGLRFRHELARSAVEDALQPASRLGLHRKMLSLLEEDDPPDLARLSHHAVKAGASESVVAYSPAAAVEAASRGAHKEAISFYEAALDHSDIVDSNDVAVWRVQLVRELGIVDRQDEALREAELAIDHYDRTDQPDRLAMALVQSSHVKWRLTDIPGALASTGRAIDLLRQLGPSRDLGYALYSASHFYMLARHRQAALDAIHESKAMGEETASEDIVWDAQMMLGTIEIVMGNARSAAQILKEAREDAERKGDYHAVAVALSMLGSGGGEARIYDEAIPALEESVDSGLATDEDYMVAYDRSWLARIAFEQGRWDDAVDYAELVDQTSLGRSGIAMMTALARLGASEGASRRPRRSRAAPRDSPVWCGA